MVNVNRPRIGIESLVYAVLTESSDVSAGTPTYGAVTALAPAAQIMVKQNGTIVTDFADDKPAFVSNTTGKIQVTFEGMDVQESDYATLLGASTGNGLVADGALDQSPWIALGYKQLLGGLDGSGNKVYIYRWLLKGKFAKPDEGGQTKKETINFQHVTLNAEFVPLLASSNSLLYQISLRTDTTTAAAAVISGFFTQPIYNTAVDLGALTLTSGVGTGATHTITLTFTKTQTTTTTITQIATLVGQALTQLVVSTVAGTMLTTGFSYGYGATSTTPTLAITNATISTATYVVVALNTITDTFLVGCTPKALTITVT